MSAICPECETKSYLSSMKMTPELVEEMARSEKNWLGIYYC